jgi:hypothetical protein
MGAGAGETVMASVAPASFTKVEGLWLKTFENPPADYRPAPFTILNDEYEPGRGEAQLTRLLESLARVGYGGAYLHPRHGLMTEYLSPRWFELIRHCVKECKRLGLVPHLYDENAYPSGFAGGHVPALVPEARSRYVTFSKGRGPASLPETYLSLYEWQENSPGQPLLRSDVKEETNWIAFLLQDFPVLAWHGETVYPSLLDPRATQAFLKTTYDAYKQELGDLWPEAASIFTDEPHLPGSAPGPWSPGLHLTPYLLGQFQQRLGYDIKQHLAELFFDVGNYRKIRYDFYDLSHCLWMENWALPLEKWCQDNEIKFTGHYLEHDWPAPYATPGHVHLLAHMDWPGTDLLSAIVLRGHSHTDIQGFEPNEAGAEPHALLYLRQVNSLANQLGKERVINEAWGASGSETTPEDWMRTARWLIVHGVNLLIPHCSWDTITGGRKADHPPNFAPQSSWFEYMRPLHDEMARLCWISNQGQSINRVLVLDSLTSAFCAARKADAFEPAAIRAMAQPFSPDPEGTLQSCLPFKRGADHFAQDLADAQIDYDLGDEYVLEEFGKATDEGLAIGQRTYPLVVLIPGLNHLRSSTTKQLTDYLIRGGRLLALEVSEFFVDGKKSDFWERMTAKFGTQIERYNDAVALRHRVAELHPPRLTLKGNVPATGVGHMHRRLENGEIFLMVNSSPTCVLAKACLSTAYGNLIALDPATGKTRQVDYVQTEKGLEADIIIKAGGSLVLLVMDEKMEDTVAPKPADLETRNSSSEVELIQAKRMKGNILVVDFCALEIQGKNFPAENVTAANLRYWNAHGLETNGWNNATQFRDHILARNDTMLPDSGGTARYSFEIEEDLALSNIQLAVERPEAWTVAVNGTKVDFELKNTFRDPRIHWTDISSLLRIGRNEVTLTGKPFSVRQEIDQIYLLGDFGCKPVEVGFRLTPASPLSWGSWKTQGMPFYDAEVSYLVRLTQGARQLSFPRETWGGALVVALQGGKEIGRAMEFPWTIELPPSSSGEVELRVVGLPINLFGPWHDPNHRWGVAIPDMWAGIHIPSQPQPGLKYGQVDAGFFRAPLVIS